MREVVAETDARQQDDTITDIEVHLNEKDSEQLFDSSHASMLQDDQQIPDMFTLAWELGFENPAGFWLRFLA